MLIIRKEQLEVLSQYTLGQFENRMVVHLHTNFSGQIKENELRTMVQIGIGRAEKYSIIMEDDIRQYLEYMVIYFPDFDTNPKTAWAGEVLRDKNLSGTEKMSKIDNISLFSMMR